MVNINGLKVMAEEQKQQAEQAKIAELQAKIAELMAQVANSNSAVIGVPKKEESKMEEVKLPKNHVEGRIDPTKRYTRISEKLAAYGRVPQQQADMADILIKGMTLGEAYTQREVWDMLIDAAGEYRSLYTSKQHVTYLFRYYLGLDKKDGKHYGYVPRNFLREFSV